MSRPGILVLAISLLLGNSFFCKAQLSGNNKDTSASGGISPSKNVPDCNENCSSILLNSLKEKDDWQIISGPAINGIHYPVQATYAKPFPSWEMDRYTADSSYFSNCDWMVLPDKKTVINTVTSIPVVLIKRFTTIAPSKFKLIVKMLYDNMAYLYIDSTRIPLNHPNAEINRFINKLQPAFTGFVSIPATFNFSYNASFYAGNLSSLALPAGDHILKIELYNNAYELGCIIKGILFSGNEEKIFCGAPIKEEQSELAGILTFRDKKAFPENELADTLYSALMQTVKTGYWNNNRLPDDQDLISPDTLFLKKGDKINISPVYITEFRNGQKDTANARGSLKKIATAKAVSKQWEKTFVFNATVPGTYWLEINWETPADTKRSTPGQLHNFGRVIKIK